MGKLGGLVKIFNDLEFEKFEEVKGDFLKIPKEVIKVESTETKIAFDPTKINTIIDRVFAFIPELVMRARIKKKLINFIEANQISIKDTLNFLDDEMAPYFLDELNDLKIPNNKLGTILHIDAERNFSSTHEMAAKVYIENVTFIEEREKLLTNYREAIKKLEVAFDEMVIESERDRDAFDGEYFKKAVEDLLGFLKGLNLK
mgnify:FL=1